MNRSRIFILVLVTTVISGTLVAGAFWLLGLAGTTGNDFRYGFVNVNEVVKKGSYFRNAQSEWTRDRRRLLNHYARQLKNLRGKSSILASVLSRQSGSSVSTPSHRHTSETGSEESRVNSAALTTIMTRRIRAQELMKRKQKQINRSGNKKIREAVETVARRQNYDVIYKKVNVLIDRREGTHQSGGLQPGHRDVTREVLRVLSSGNSEND